MSGETTDSPENASPGGPWIHSSPVDLGLFILSPLLALPVMALTVDGPNLISLTAGTMLGGPHYLSTFAFFFWSEGRRHHQAHRVTFFVTPAVIAGSIWLMAAVHVPYVIQVVVYVWNTVHVARQSCGLLSIYRHRAGASDRSLKAPINRAVIATALAMAFWNTAWYPTLHRFMTILWTDLPRAVTALTIGAAIVALIGLVRSLHDRVRRGPALSGPEAACLLSSLLLFHPYLWVRNANLATLGVLLGHFVQYLGLVWLVHRRRFTHARDEDAPAWLVTLSTSLPALLAAGLAGGLLFLVPQLAARSTPLVGDLFEPWFLSLALVHFYLDGLFWAFKRPEVRRQLAPFLIGPAPQRSSVTA